MPARDGIPPEREGRGTMMPATPPTSGTTGAGLRCTMSTRATGWKQPRPPSPPTRAALCWSGWRGWSGLRRRRKRGLQLPVPGDTNKYGHALGVIRDALDGGNREPRAKFAQKPPARGEGQGVATDKKGDTNG